MADNPILNNPYLEPKIYYNTDIQGNLDYSDIKKGRRIYSHDITPQPTQRPNTQQGLFNISDIQDRYEEHLINVLRKEVSIWRKNKYPNTTRITKLLLDYWFDSADRIDYHKLFFAQQEAVETAIFLNEIADKSNSGQAILNRLRNGQVIVEKNSQFNLPRIAFKMATGSGKTVVMAMLILYHFYNRLEYRNDTRFADNFIIIAPGITIKDRLGVLYVDTQNNSIQNIQDYYRTRRLIPQNYEQDLLQLNSKLIITNYHSFEQKVLKGNKKTPFDGKIGADGKKVRELEDYSLVLKRIVGKFKKGSRILVINDEAHHCYLPKVKEKNVKHDDSEGENERASIWFNGIVELSKQYQLRYVYDLSATPYFLQGSGYESYSLFPWTVSDFGLIEAIESGLVKIPFLPESDSTQQIEMPVLRNLYEHIKKDLPKKGASSLKLSGAPKLPELIKIALDQFYSHYEKSYNEFRDLFGNPPVFIIVCNNTNVSSEVFKYIAGYEIDREDKTKLIIPGNFELFSNYQKDTLKPLDKCPTLLIDSNALENSEQIDEQFKKIFTSEIEIFKKEYRIMHPDKSADNLIDSDILREVVNTVGKQGMLGGHIRCVVSVSMLTEGWDANTVTHIMGIRAFGSQLLCEQVAGRALRRSSYFLGKDGKFPPEYAHIIGVPFRFFKGGKSAAVIVQDDIKIIKALQEREKYEIIFPNITGYRVESESQIYEADFSKVEDYVIDGSVLPVQTDMKNAFSSDKEILTLEKCKEKREQELIYLITKNLLSFYYSDINGFPEFQLFNQLKKIVHEWYEFKIKLSGPAFKQMLYYCEPKNICNHIKRGIDSKNINSTKIFPVFNYYNKLGSTKYVHGATSKEIYATKNSHINYVVADTKSWEQIAAKTFEELSDKIYCYVKNAFLGFSIPYIKDDKDRQYFPDFIVKCKTKNKKFINLIVEITGMNQDKSEKRWYLLNRWLPAVNSVSEMYGYDKFDFMEISDIKNIKELLRIKIQSL
ncbi:DEAD/DEAH box helicase family protein [Candidatus Dependentiae bacterium]|nr:DEAD/DEAH box helicase family protein [Candidatus Dependentiae bacterium]